LGLYRVIKYPGRTKLSTITDAFTGIKPTVGVGEIGSVWSRLFAPLVGKPPKGEDYLLSMRSAGPNCKISMLGAPYDAYVLASRYPSLLNAFLTVNQYFDSSLSNLLDREIQHLSHISEVLGSKEDEALGRKLRIGKLSLKEEPAGKVRVFAIGDVFSQTCLRPIHDHIFSILEKIPQDGTFNQGRPLEYLVDSLNKRDTDESRTVYSYDLSAATDRVPIAFQVQMMSLLYNFDVARA